MWPALRANKTRLLLLAIAGVTAGVGYFLVTGGGGERAPSGTIAFAAGGAIYAVEADGSGQRLVVPGDRDIEPWRPLGNGLLPGSLPEWASAPAYSADGTQIAFVRDFDIWLAGADGRDAHRLVEVARIEPSPGASNWSTGVTNVAWSADGQTLLYGMARIGGSGLGFIETINVDGSARLSRRWTAGFQVPQWGPEGRIIASGSRGEAVLLDGVPDTAPETVPLGEAAWPGLLSRSRDGEWLVGSFIEEAPVMFGPAGALQEIALGVSPVLSPDGGWVAYFSGDSLRLVQVDGSDDHELVDVATLGGRDRHFASMPDCYPEQREGCSYRPPMMSWVVGR